MKFSIRYFGIGLLLIFSNLFSETTSTIESGVKEINKKIIELKQELQEKFLRAQEVIKEKDSEEGSKKLLSEINEIKKSIYDVENEWRKLSVDESMKTDEGYGFWDQGETTLSQLIMEYGAMDYLYVIPQELGSMKINLFSTIPIPHESWNEILELILMHNGIGVKKLNSYLRQLYILKHDPTNVEAIATSKLDLQLLANHAWICYVFSPPPEQTKAVQAFFERFSDIKQSTVQIVGSKVVIIASKEVVERLLGLYDAVWEEGDGKSIKVIALSKVDVAEAERILKTFFQEPQGKGRPGFYQGTIDELSIFTLNNSIVLLGEKQLISRAEKVLEELESQLNDPDEMTIFWYTCKHSDPEDLAGVLEKVYFSLSSANLEERKKVKGEIFNKTEESSPKNFPKSLTVSPANVEMGKISQKSENQIHNNFIVDSKSGSILMVVKKEDLGKIKTLLAQLDVPKKMVQIDVLLVERKINDRKQSGINLLQIGTSRGERESSIGFDATGAIKKKGILDFILSRPKGSFPAFDIALSFLMAKDDMQINASPSILAINQTPATISIVDEISINNGAIQTDSSRGLIEKSFTRAQYGITIVMTPTINISEDNGQGFVTLQTDVTFDTTQMSEQDRPPVTRRHIENEVRVADGETIILGGLRRKIGEEGNEKIPFLGDIPGIGKLFGSNKKNDSSTEMFIFITPHIIRDPIEDMQKIRSQMLKQRAGDIPEFLESLNRAKEEEKKQMFEESIKLVFDKL